METIRFARGVVRALAATVLLLTVGCGGSEATAERAADAAGAAAAAAPAGPPRLPVEEAWCGAAPCPCQDGTMRALGNGQPEKCTLAQAATIQGVPCAADKPLDFFDDGRLESCHLGADTTFGSFPCAADNMVVFRDTGIFKSCHVTEPVEVTGMTCQSLVSIHPDGSIKYCNVVREQQVSGQMVPAGHNVELHPDGHLHRWEVVKHTVTTGGLTCRATMMFYPDGTVAECRRLAEPYTSGEQTIAADERVCFDPQGTIIDCSTSHQHIKAFPE